MTFQEKISTSTVQTAKPRRKPKDEITIEIDPGTAVDSSRAPSPAGTSVVSVPDNSVSDISAAADDIINRMVEEEDLADFEFESCPGAGDQFEDPDAFEDSDPDDSASAANKRVSMASWAHSKLK